MITFDKLKIVASMMAVEVCDKNRFETIEKGGVITSMKYYQEHPYLLMIKVDYENDEVVIEFSGKVLGRDYPKLISSDTIVQCFDAINAIGIIRMDIDAMMDADVVKCDVTKDIHISDIPRMTQYVRNHISNYQQFLCRKLRNGNLVVEKNVVSRKTKKRMTIYDKGKEMQRAENRAFVEENGLENAFNGVCRFELNLDTKEQIRKALHIHNTKLTSVLSSASNPIDEFIDCIVPPQNESVNLPDKKTYVAKLILKDCDYDLEKVEAKMREFYRRGTSVTALMKPYRELLQQMGNKGDEDLWSDVRRQLKA